MREFVIGSQGRGKPPWLLVFVPGVALLAFGILIVVLPQLLVALVAAVCMVAGIALASLGWRLRGMSNSGGMNSMFSRVFDAQR